MKVLCWYDSDNGSGTVVVEAYSPRQVESALAQACYETCMLHDQRTLFAGPGTVLPFIKPVNARLTMYWPQCMSEVW